MRRMALCGVNTVPPGMSSVGSLTRGRPSQAYQVPARSRQRSTASGISSVASPRTVVVMPTG
jgi:hypothetical protein